MSLGEKEKNNTAWVNASPWECRCDRFSFGSRNFRLSTSVHTENALFKSCLRTVLSSQYLSPEVVLLHLVLPS